MVILHFKSTLLTIPSICVSSFACSFSCYSSSGPPVLHWHQSFIHRLPTELLCCIFLMCGEPSPVASYPRDDHMHRADVDWNHFCQYSRSAVLLGRVCSRWFTVTRGFPRLWTVFDVGAPFGLDFVALQLCLRHSANLPLSLRIRDYTSLPSENDLVSKLLKHLMCIVANHAGRWEEISLHVLAVKDILDPLLALPHGAFSCLARASLITEERRQPTSDDPIVLLWKAFHSQPSLRVVEWPDIPLNFVDLGNDPLLKNLTHLGMGAVAQHDLLSLLRHCPLVQVLQASILHRSSNEITLRSPLTVRLRRLRQLILTGSDDMTAIYSSLVVPALRRLDLSTTKVQHEAIIDMLTRSTAHLVMLTLHCSTYEHRDNIAALLQDQSLQQLKILRYDIRTVFPNWRTDDASYDLSPFTSPGVEFFIDWQDAEDAYKTVTSSL
ncbi:hypothetical protein BD626DRAFT_468702 [Schizophyllum amplum]|uniref:F-box domain-containing protein n=1 Tax=Schizophyllum amplum TaxID=97359 RepID=A0A550BSG9_9AGAR|nr:hypothetical protein BD626DRAFT_468702 [Auriculariopsis ampla]